MYQRRVHGTQSYFDFKMRAIILLTVFATFLYVASSLPSVKTSCTIMEAIACNDEINAAMNDCGHITDINGIITCINDILGASDCGKCVCDVLPFLCSKM